MVLYQTIPTHTELIHSFVLDVPLRTTWLLDHLIVTDADSGPVRDDYQYPIHAYFPSETCLEAQRRTDHGRYTQCCLTMAFSLPLLQLKINLPNVLSRMGISLAVGHVGSRVLGTKFPPYERRDDVVKDSIQ